MFIITNFEKIINEYIYTLIVPSIKFLSTAKKNILYQNDR